ncbi:hypothetical protein JCGZ_10825 [Jatropha curcas]|uniref:Uncharacterized protein n=1 Tax=Jatropha curcas TaxID=180498 RepID=A0A067KH47_JATCU|nr:hypothetical protein JCGZ_10825 [Jatropha curcas]
MVDRSSRMKEYIPRSVFIERTLEALETHFSVKANLDAVQATNAEGFVHSPKLLTKQELEDARESMPENIA